MCDETSLHVNGADHRVRAEPDTPLIHVLRNLLGLRATRFGCGQEQCGACMVLVDGAPAYSCTLPLDGAAGHAVETADALGPDHPLVRAFLLEQAGQCGYCLSGILMSAKALLARTPRPAPEEIVAALDPHLCRCGAHPRILRAVARAAAWDAGAEAAA